MYHRSSWKTTGENEKANWKNKVRKGGRHFRRPVENINFKVNKAESKMVYSTAKVTGKKPSSESKTIVKKETAAKNLHVRRARWTHVVGASATEDKHDRWETQKQATCQAKTRAIELKASWPTQNTAKKSKTQEQSKDNTEKKQWK